MNDPDPTLLQPAAPTCPVIAVAPAIHLPLANRSLGTVHAPETLRPEIVFAPAPVSSPVPLHYELEVSSPSFPTFREQSRVSACDPARAPGVWCHRLDLRDQLTSSARPAGARVRVRARACCGDVCDAAPWSTPRLFAVGRPRQDLDGDGYADVAIAGQYGASDGRAAVLVHFGGPGRFLDWNEGTPPVLSPRIILELSAHHGALAFVGDFEGDGHPDLAVGGPTLEPRARLTLVRGGPHLRDRVLPPAVVLAPSGRASRFGETLAAGDVDGDGCEELAVTDGDSSTTAGTLYLYRAARCCADVDEGCVADPTPVLARELPAEHYTRFRWISPLVGGDFDGDGLADFAFLAPGKTPQVLRGGALDVYDVPADGPAYPVAAGDLDGDGAEDLLTRRVGDDFAVLVHYGERGRGLAAASGEYLTRGFGVKSGIVVSGDDLNGDGLDDLAAVAWGMFAEVHLGALDRARLADIAATITPDPRAGQCWSRSHPTGTWASAGALAGDVNGDGFGELVIADPTVGLGFCLDGCERCTGDCPSDCQQHCRRGLLGGFGVYFGAPGRSFAQYTTSCWWGLEPGNVFGGAVALP